MKKNSYSYFLTILLGICLLTCCTKDDGGDPKLPPADLSADATANCYIVSSAGSYTFKTVRGNTAKSVGNVATAAVLWESFGTDVKPSAGIHAGLASAGEIRFLDRNDRLCGQEPHDIHHEREKPR